MIIIKLLRVTLWSFFGRMTWTMFTSTVGSRLPQQRIIQRWKFWRCRCNLLHSFGDAPQAFMFGSLEANVKDGHWTLTEPHRGKDKREFPFGVQCKVRNKERRDITKTKQQLIKSLEGMPDWSLHFKLQELNQENECWYHSNDFGFCFVLQLYKCLSQTTAALVSASG